MRRPELALLIAVLAPLAACGPDARTIPVNVNWMEWPEEVPPDTRFDVRIVVYEPCALDPRFRPDPIVTSDALIFTPYFLAGGDLMCGALLTVASLDTVIAAPGLEGATPPADPRTYRMMARSPAWALLAPPTGTPPEPPPGLFGEVTVRLDMTFALTAPRTRAGGMATVADDAEGCPRLLPAGTTGPGYPLANPPGFPRPWSAFVRGHLELAAEQVCGEPRAFLLDEEPSPFLVTRSQP